MGVPSWPRQSVLGYKWPGGNRELRFGPRPNWPMGGGVPTLWGEPKDLRIGRARKHIRIVPRLCSHDARLIRGIEHPRDAAKSDSRKSESENEVNVMKHSCLI